MVLDKEEQALVLYQGYSMDFILPQIANAQSVGALISNIKTAIVNPIIGIVFALAFLLFVWGVAVFLMKADDSTAREQGKNHIIYGLIGMFIMVSVFGILNIITNTLGVSSVK